MWTKVTIGGLVAVAAIAGTAGAAIAHAQGASPQAAATASPTSSATATSTAAAGAKPGKDTNATKGTKADRGGVAKEILGHLKDFQHAEWVTKGDANTYVTHEAILGTVQSVSPSSITVASADGTSITFSVTDRTTVRQRTVKGAPAGPPAGTKPTIADVRTGQTVLVGGAKAPDLSAATVLVRAG
jgi:hypothetical protein